MDGNINYSIDEINRRLGLSDETYSPLENH